MAVCGPFYLFRRGRIYYVQYALDGVTKQKSTGCTTKGAATAYVELLPDKVSVRPTKAIKLSEYMRDYLKLKQGILRQSTLIRIDQIGRIFLRVSGDRLLTSFTLRDVEDYKAARLETCCATTVNVEILLPWPARAGKAAGAFDRPPACVAHSAAQSGTQTAPGVVLGGPGRFPCRMSRNVLCGSRCDTVGSPHPRAAHTVSGRDTLQSRRRPTGESTRSSGAGSDPAASVPLAVPPQERSQHLLVVSRSDIFSQAYPP